MIKLYCDRCGREINGDVFNIKIEYANDIQDKSIMTSSINDDLQNFLRNERIYCERCTGKIREALEPLEASEHESRDEYLFSPNAIFMEMKEICRRQEKCADCALSGICDRTINEIKMEDVHRAMNAVKKRKEQKQAENKSI